MKVVSLVLPWLVAPGIFLVVVAAVHAWNTESLQIGLLFVVFPLTVWAALLGKCKEQLHDPVFGPSFISATVGTAISAGLNVALGLATVTTCYLFWRTINSDPGQFPVLPTTDSNIGWSGNQEWTQTGDRDMEALNKGFSQTSDFVELSKEDDPSSALAIEQDSPKILPTRARYCRKCNAWIDHFDHHCPAIMNCVGRKNHGLFLATLLAFIVVECLYAQGCYSYLQQQQLFSLVRGMPSVIMDGLRGVEQSWLIVCQVMSRAPWVASTAVFASLQALWQTPLLAFHIYCAAINLTTNEWIKWEHYPTLYVNLPPGRGRPLGAKKFVNPYDRGITLNLLQFFQSRV